MPRYRYAFDLVTDDSVNTHDIPSQNTVMEAVKAQMAAELTPAQKRHMKVEAVRQHNGHHHNAPRGDYCAYCDNQSRDGQY